VRKQKGVPMNRPRKQRTENQQKMTVYIRANNKNETIPIKPDQVLNVVQEI
jgi:LysM repeat protein